MNLYSRRIVGWAMDRAVGRHLVCEALTMALGYRQPEDGLVPPIEALLTEKFYPNSHSEYSG